MKNMKDVHNAVDAIVPPPPPAGGPSGVYGCAGQEVGNAFAPHGIVIILDLGAVGYQG